MRNIKYIGRDIDIQVRDNYINLYYKGASLTKFEWKSNGKYSIEISEEYFKPAEPEGFIEFRLKRQRDKSKIWICKFDNTSINKLEKKFKEIVLQLKRNIRYLGKGQENAFEQLFIDNNLKEKYNPEFIILDRQIVVGKLDRLDLIALSKIQKSDKYRINLIELKYGEDPRIPDVHNEQLNKYYTMFFNDYEHIATEYENIIKQKIAISRWPYSKIKYVISKDKNTMRKIAIFGNIDEKNALIEQAKKQFDKNTYYAVQNNVLNEKHLRNRNQCNS